MVRFRDRDDVNYRRVAGVLQRWAKELEVPMEENNVVSQPSTWFSQSSQQPRAPPRTTPSELDVTPTRGSYAQHRRLPFMDSYLQPSDPDLSDTQQIPSPNERRRPSAVNYDPEQAREQPHYQTRILPPVQSPKQRNRGDRPLSTQDNQQRRREDHRYPAPSSKS
jgi:hypothetical protein